jgi:hypothetical protein
MIVEAMKIESLTTFFGQSRYLTFHIIVTQDLFGIENAESYNGAVLSKLTNQFLVKCFESFVQHFKTCVKMSIKDVRIVKTYGAIHSEVVRTKIFPSYYKKMMKKEYIRKKIVRTRKQKEHIDGEPSAKKIKLDKSGIMQKEDIDCDGELSAEKIKLDEEAEKPKRKSALIEISDEGIKDLTEVLKNYKQKSPFFLNFINSK